MAKYCTALITECKELGSSSKVTIFIIFLLAISINFCASTRFVLLWYFMFGVINVGSFFLVDICLAIRVSARHFVDSFMDRILGLAPSL